MRATIFFVFFLLTFSGFAQKSHITPKDFDREQNNVLRVVLNVFEAMRSSDSTLLASCFVAEPDMYTSFMDKAGKPKLQKGNFKGFKNAVASKKEQVWDEPVWGLKVEINGDLAMAWMSYAFYLGKELLHCGVDVMLLHKQDHQWKIYHISDTRQKEACELPEGLQEGRELPKE